MPKVSVIMPCLNMEKYIGESLESVLGQTLGDIEVLVVDAGSTDATLDIIKRYLCKDKRINLIHSDKKSYGYQVNLGIGRSTGEYITIVDTDDRIVPDMYETLYPVAVSTGADYVKGAVDYFYTVKGGYEYHVRFVQFPEDAYGEGGIEVAPKDTPGILLKDGFVWCGIYRNDFFRKVRFHESPGAAYQDLGGLLQTLTNAEKGVYINKIVYEYRQDNINASGYNPKAFEFIIDEYGWSEALLDGMSAEWHTVFYYKFFTQVLSRFDIMDNLGRSWEGTGDVMGRIRDRLYHAVAEGILSEKDLEEGHRECFRLFMESPDKLYEEIGRNRRRNRKAVREMLQVMGDRNAVIFGGGKLGGFLHLLLLNNRLDNVKAFCDNNDFLDGTILQGKYVLNPEKAVLMYPDAVFIIANPKCSAEMRRQLADLGIKESDMVDCKLYIDMGLLRESFV